MIDRCCWFFTLHFGCLAASIAQMGLVAGEGVAIFLDRSLPKDLQALVMFRSILLVIGSLLLMVGTLKADRVCVIIFIFFDLTGIMLLLVGLVFAGPNHTCPNWFIVLMMFENGIHAYMLPIATCRVNEIKRSHAFVRNRALSTQYAVNLLNEQHRSQILM